MFSLPARLDALPELNRELSEFAQACRLDGETVHALELTLEELFVNLVRHAPTGMTARLSLQFHEGRVQATLEDDGPPFNPTRPPMADVESRLDERRIGGLGLHFVHALARVHYERRGETNVVTLEVLR